MTIQAAELPIVSSAHHQPMFADPSKSKSIFELRGRYVELASCSSAQSVVPVRLGRALATRTPSSPDQSCRRRRPVPPCPQDNASIISNNNKRGGRVGRHVRPRAAAAVTMIQRVVRRHCFANSSTGGVGVGGDGGGYRTGSPFGSQRSCGATSPGRRIADKSQDPSRPCRRSPSPARAVDSTTDSAPSIGNGGPAATANVPSCDPRTADDPHIMGRAEASSGTGHLEASQAGDTEGGITHEDAAGGGGDDGGGCSRGPRCGASSGSHSSSSSDQLRIGEGPEVATILEKYTHLETYDCPVSPFSAPPSWADVPPLATLEPPGFSRSWKTLTDDASATVSGTKAEQSGESEGRARTSMDADGGWVSPGAVEKMPNDGLRPKTELPSGERSRPLSLLPTTTTADDEFAMTATTRPAEKTLFQTISSGRRVSYGWGWTRPSGERGGRNRRGEVEKTGAGPSPSLMGRGRRARAKTIVSASPSTSWA